MTDTLLPIVVEEVNWFDYHPASPSADAPRHYCNTRPAIQLEENGGKKEIKGINDVGVRKKYAV